MESRVRQWARWSMTPHTEDEIRQRYLTDFDLICTSYVCRYSRVSEKFIEEMLALSTGLLNLDTYDKNIDTLIKLEQDKLLKDDDSWMKYIPKLKIPAVQAIYCKDGKWMSQADIASGMRATNIFNDKLDWQYIAAYQRLSAEFKEKYKAYLVDMELEYAEQITYKYMDMTDHKCKKGYRNLSKAVANQK